jgi:hypothetical protein
LACRLVQTIGQVAQRGGEVRQDRVGPVLGQPPVDGDGFIDRDEGFFAACEPG